MNDTSVQTFKRQPHKMSKTNGQDTPYLSVFSPNAGKCGPE